MAIKSVFAFVGLALIMIALYSFKSKERSITYQQIEMSEYQNFINNWDENKSAVLYALIQTPARYDALFHPAALNGAARPYAPEPELYFKEQILVIARVMQASENMGNVFEVERVMEKGRELTLYYRYNEPKNDATFTIKNYLAIRIPKRDYKKVVFIENGKLVGNLYISQGQWSVPEMKNTDADLE
jgi:hypothetical protein